MSKVRRLRADDISPEDAIIALMGPTGVGKSTFISAATQQGSNNVGHNLQSCTGEIRAIRVSRPTDSGNVVLVDTPGFDDTTSSDTEILKMIASWLSKTYKRHITLAGIIYMHRISDNRIAGTPLKNFSMFTKLCGPRAAQNVIIATTMWGRVPSDLGRRRERELQEKWWKPMLELGSATARFLDTFESAWSVIDSVLVRGSMPSPLLLQEEMVDLRLRLNQTEAGKTLYDTLQKLLAKQKEDLRTIRENEKMQDDSGILCVLVVRYNELEENIRKTCDDIREMRISLRTRILMFFTYRNHRARCT
ncbi:P-loop containing nucleoside triphosphate hydrolase protein [Sparassis latifolia]